MFPVFLKVKQCLPYMYFSFSIKHNISKILKPHSKSSHSGASADDAKKTPTADVTPAATSSETLTSPAQETVKEEEEPTEEKRNIYISTL